MPTRNTPVLPLPMRMREARLRAEISQRQLGIEARIDPDSASARINQYEQGRHSPDFQTAARLAECLNVPVTYFYAPDDRMAEMILIFDALTVKSKNQVLKEASELLD